MDTEEVDAEASYRTLIEQSIVGIYVIQDGRFVYVNPRMTEIFGYGGADMIARPLADFIAPEDRAMVSDNVRKRLDGTTESIHYTLQIVRRDGTRGHAEAHGSRIEYKKRPAILGTLLDITARVNAQAALEHTEQQLRQSQKMEAIGQLAGGIAHDFNNLLTIINGYSQLILDRTQPNEKTRRELEMICKTGERAAAMVQKLLAFSRQQMYEPTLLDVNAIVTDMEQIMRRLLREDITIKIALKPELPSIISDASHIEQIVMNLAVNARDAINGPGTVTIETAKVELDRPFASSHLGVKPGTYVMLAVSDTGCGMSELVKSRIFEPFFTTKGVGLGTGLGLATVYGIVKQNGGIIDVYSEIGRGSVFKVYLPACRERATASAPSQKRVTPRGIETILVVEDDDGVRAVTRDMLQAQGYTVLDCKDGSEAIERCRSHNGEIHMMLSDIVMPVVGGPQLAQHLLLMRPAIKILFMSGYTEHGISEIATVPRAKFIVKPFSSHSLGVKIREMLDAYVHA